MSLKFWCNCLECHRSSPLRYKTCKQQSNTINLSVTNRIVTYTVLMVMRVVNRYKLVNTTLGAYSRNEVQLKTTYNSVGSYVFK